MNKKILFGIFVLLCFLPSVFSLTLTCPSDYTAINSCDFTSSDDADDCGYSGGTLGSGVYSTSTSWAVLNSGDLSLSDYTSIVTIYNVTHPTDHTTYKYYGYEESGTTDNIHLLGEDGGATMTFKPEPVFFPSCSGVTYNQSILTSVEWDDTDSSFNVTIDDGSECTFSTTYAINTTAGRDYLRTAVGDLAGGTYELHDLLVCAPTSEVSSDSCTYSGSGDWTIDLTDNCEITDTQDANGNSVFVTGDAGTLTIASGGKIISQERHFTPTDFDGDSIIEIKVGGSWEFR